MSHVDATSLPCELFSHALWVSPCFHENNQLLLRRWSVRVNKTQSDQWPGLHTLSKGTEMFGSSSQRVFVWERQFGPVKAKVEMSDALLFRRTGSGSVLVHKWVVNAKKSRHYCPHSKSNMFLDKPVLCSKDVFWCKINHRPHAMGRWHKKAIYPPHRGLQDQQCSSKPASCRGHRSRQPMRSSKTHTSCRMKFSHSF